MVEWSKRVTKNTVRRNGRCRTCKRARTQVVTVETERTYRSDKFGEVGRRTAVTLENGTRAPAGFECCGRSWDFKAVRGRLNPEKQCSAKCQASVGHTCECSCGGKNHGAAHA